VERKNLEHADAVHFTADLEQEEYAKLGYDLRKAVVISNGFDPESMPLGDPQDFRRKFSIAAEKKIILSLGRLSWKKGFDTLIPAFALAAKEIPEALLVIAGGDDEGYKATIEKLIQANGISDKVLFTGPLEGKDKDAAYKAGELFVLPSYAENFAITVVESMSSGTPVLVTGNVGLASQVEQGGFGVVVRKEPVEVAAAIMRLLRDPDGARRMGERGKAFAASLSYEKISRSFLEAYNDIIAGHRTHS